MAVITANGSKGKHKFTLEVTETSYSVDMNTSNINFTFKISPIKTGYNWSGWGSYISYTVTVNGTDYTGTIGSYNGSSTVTLKDVNLNNIVHNNDGTKTVTFSFNVTDTSGQSYTCGNASASGSITLTTIPRTSQITVADANIGSSTNITINKNSDSFKTTLYYRAAGQSNYTKIVDKTSLNVYGWTVPTSFYALIPNNKKITCEFYGVTWNGDTMIGISETVTATFTATGNPTIDSFTLVDTNSTTIALTGDSSKMVKYASNVKATITASGQHSATIPSNGITVNGTTASSGVVTFTGATTNSFKAIVTDSRGYPTTQTKTMTSVNYVPLTINATIVRNQPTDEKIKITYNGNYFNSSFGSQSNTLTVQYRYREKNGSWQSWTNLSPTKSGNTYSQTTTISGFDYTKQYEFQIRATDKIKSVPITGINVSKGQPVFWWNDEKLAVTGKLVIPKSDDISKTGIFNSNGDVVFQSYANNNSILNAGGGALFLGYQNTPNGINLLNGKAKIDATTGMYKVNNVNLLESGSNTNGNYIKFSDGTMIEWNRLQVKDQAISSAYGSLYQGTRAITFPIAFVGEIPTCQCSDFQWGNGASWGCVGGRTLTGMTCRGIDVLSRATGTNVYISWFAIGKWK